MKIWRASALLFCLAALPARPHASVERFIEEDIRVGLPLVPCALPAAAWRIARSVGVPLGLELIAESCRLEAKPKRDADEQLILTGLTAREAFDRLQHMDPRYRWIESDGVLVIRPTEAWDDRDHFLHRTVTSFTVNDRNMAGALDAVRSALGPERVTMGEQFPGTTRGGAKRFSISLGATSILEALNAVVRTHGALSWRITYCRPPARYEHATVEFLAHDGSGIGGRAFPRREDGTSYDPCRAEGRK
jgi:hypothetical protein